MALTEEQKKRIEENRKRALEIRKQKQAEKDRQDNPSSAEKGVVTNSTGGFIFAGEHGQQHKKRKTESETSSALHPTATTSINKIPSNQSKNELDDDEESLEDFEYSATEYITKAEAQRVYCLPQGTLAVCSYTERENPHKKGWSSMKLYSRSEVRRRSRKRFGGKEGLIRERERRKEKRLEKDLEEMKDVFR
jgi:DNA-repair protein complementing XP-A cells